MNLDDLGPERTVVIYPGRFQPWHMGHACVYSSLINDFGAENVFVVTSDKTGKDSPFSFDDRVIMMKAMGVPLSNIVQSAQPLRAMELMQNFNMDRTKLVLAVGEKDMRDKPRFHFGQTKDGKQSYYQRWETGIEMKSLRCHGYVKVMPTVSFNLSEIPIDSATEVRQAWINSDSFEKQMLMQKLYGSAADDIFDVFMRCFNAGTSQATPE